MTDSSATRGLWLRWVLASALGGVVFARVARRVSMAAGNSVGDVAAETVMGALALGGIMAGVVAAVVATALSGIALGELAGGGVGGGVFGAAYATVSGFVVLPRAVGTEGSS